MGSGTFDITNGFQERWKHRSPVIKTPDGVSWWLDFYPVGDDDNTDSFVFWVNRSDSEREIKVSFEIQFCFNTNPVRQYTLKHTFEKGEDVHKWVVDDVRNLTQLKIFIPPSGLCFIVYLRFPDSDDTFESKNFCKDSSTSSEDA